MKKNVTIKGLDSFDELEIQKIEEIVYTAYDKIQRDVKGAVVLLAKKHNKDGNRARYSFQGKIDAPDTIINVRSTDWELERAVHKLMNKLQSSAQNRFRK